MNSDTVAAALDHVDERYILEAAQFRSRPARRSACVLRRLCALTAAAVLCICVALPALAAANVEGAYTLLYAISPALAQQLKPVNLACEDNGIRMEVLSADVSTDFSIASGDTAHIYIALTDLTGDRIDETVDLFDSFFIRTPFDSIATCRTVSYDADARTATFLLSITHMQGEPIDGEKLTLSLKRFISGKQSFSVAIPGIDPGAAPVSPATQTDVALRSGTPDAGYTAFLLPNETLSVSPMEGVTITAMGFIDGRLHVQAHCADILSLDTNGYLKLYTADNHPIEPIEQISFWDDAHTGSYEEYIFDVSPQTAAGTKLFGFFSAAQTVTEGDWSVTFPIE